MQLRSLSVVCLLGKVDLSEGCLLVELGGRSLICAITSRVPASCFTANLTSSFGAFDNMTASADSDAL